MGFRPHHNLTRDRTDFPVGSRVPRARKMEGTPIGMKKLMAYVLAAFLLGGVAMGKGTSAARNAKGAKSGGAQITAVEGRARTPSASQGGRVSSRAVTGNLSKLRRERLLSHIAAIKTFLERSVGTDTNAVRLLSFAAELEKEVRDKKYGLVFEEHRERVDVELDENIPVLQEVKERFLAAKNAKDGSGARVTSEAPLNFLIEGDNLAALKLLEKTHRGRIDLIYIDPPYNTGNEDFVYNDSYVDKTDTFRHSKWLSFMKKRLQVMRLLLSYEGYICISIDDNELYTLKILCDEIFAPENFVACLPRRRKSSGKTTKDISLNHDYVLIYAKDNSRVAIGGLVHIDAGFKHEDEYVEKRGKFKLNQTLDYDSLQYSRSLDYPIEIEGEVFYPGQDKEAWEKRMAGEHKRADWEWRWSKELFEFGLANGFIVVKRKKDGTARIYTKTYLNASIQQKGNGDYEIVYLERVKPLSTLDFLGKEFSNDKAKKDLKDVFGYCPFDYSKPLELVEKLVSISLKTSPLVLDCFAGSGTTGHAVMKLNAEDGGRRRFILVTNNENGICEKVTYERLKRVMAKEKYAARLKYYKVGFVPITEDGYWERADALLGYIRELVELENGIDFSHDTSVAIVLTDEELGRFVKGLAKNTALPRILYKGHNVILDAKAKAAIEKQGVEVKTIPDYYYPELED